MKLFLAVAVFLCCTPLSAGEAFKVIEWTGVGQPEDCDDFPKSDVEVSRFLELADKPDTIDATFDYDVACYIEGVALDEKARYVEFAINRAGVGLIFGHGQIQTLQCQRGSLCCKELPGFCAELR